MYSPRKCCFCINLKIGTLILSAIEIGIFGIISVATMTVVHRFREIHTTMLDEMKQKYWESVDFSPKGYAATLLGISMVSLLVIAMNIHLIFGIFRKKSKLIWQWLMISTAAVWIIFILSLILYGIDKRMGKETYLGRVLFDNFLLLVFHGYFGACAYGLLKTFDDYKSYESYEIVTL